VGEVMSLFEASRRIAQSIKSIVMGEIETMFGHCKRVSEIRFNPHYCSVMYFTNEGWEVRRYYKNQSSFEAIKVSFYVDELTVARVRAVTLPDACFTVISTTKLEELANETFWRLKPMLEEELGVNVGGELEVELEEA